MPDSPFGIVFTVFGAFCSTLGVVLPSFIVILLVAKFYEKFKESRIVKGCMSGLKPTVVGLIATALLSVATTVFVPNGFSVSMFTNISLYVSLGIFAIAVVMAFRKVHPILIIALSALIGIAAGYLILI